MVTVGLYAKFSASQNSTKAVKKNPAGPKPPVDRENSKPFASWPVQDVSCHGVGCGLHSLTKLRHSRRLNHFIMTVKNTKTTFSAFEAMEIKIAHQLQVKGGTDGSGEQPVAPKPIIGDDDIIQS